MSYLNLAKEPEPRLSARQKKGEDRRRMYDRWELYYFVCISVLAKTYTSLVSFLWQIFKKISRHSSCPLSNNIFSNNFRYLSPSFGFYRKRLTASFSFFAKRYIFDETARDQLFQQLNFTTATATPSPSLRKGKQSGHFLAQIKKLKISLLTFFKFKKQQVVFEEPFPEAHNYIYTSGRTTWNWKLSTIGYLFFLLLRP